MKITQIKARLRLIAARIAAREFQRRSRGKPRRNAEIHVSDDELGELLELAAAEGYREAQRNARKAIQAIHDQLSTRCAEKTVAEGGGLDECDHGSGYCHRYDSLALTAGLLRPAT